MVGAAGGARADRRCGRSKSCGRGAAAAVPRHHPRLVDRLGCMPMPRRRTHGRGSPGGDHRRRDRPARARGCRLPTPRPGPPRGDRRRRHRPTMVVRRRAVVGIGPPSSARSTRAPRRPTTGRGHRTLDEQRPSPWVGTSMARSSRSRRGAGQGAAARLAGGSRSSWRPIIRWSTTRGTSRSWTASARCADHRPRRHRGASSAGPLLAELVVPRTFGESTSRPDVPPGAGSARLDIVFDIEWHEDEHLLSLMVPLDVRTDEAICDVQFGQVRRPTHASSSWDAAKFEVCAHRFVDLAEPSFGVAVLNNGRYGHGVQGGPSVFAAAGRQVPRPRCRPGPAQVTISVFPHGPGQHDVLHEAEALNLPLRSSSRSSRRGAATSGVRRSPAACRSSR